MTEELNDLLDELVQFRTRELHDMQMSGKFSKDALIQYEIKTLKINDMIGDDIKDEKHAELEDQIKRLLADFDNYKKRTAKTASDQSFNEKKKVILEFLNAYDDIERVFRLIDNGQRTLMSDGLSKIFAKIESTFINLGCKKIDCKIGMKFDVNTMEAISATDIGNSGLFHEDDVIEVYQSGWMLDDAIIRHAKVVVGK